MQSISQESIRADAFAVYEIFLQDLGSPPVVQHDSNLTGRLYYEELMAIENAARFHNLNLLTVRMYYILYLSHIHSLSPN
jgi:hypothetical protein